MNGQSVICKHNYPDQNCCPRCEIDRLTTQLAEAKASAEAWQENCHMTERELEKERNKHAETIANLAERDGAITCYNEVLAELREENTALRDQLIVWIPVTERMPEPNVPRSQDTMLAHYKDLRKIKA